MQERSARVWLELLRWHKPSGRLILLIPAGWSLWLTPAVPPSPTLVLLLLIGALGVSGAGCIANDLWDRRIDPLVSRTATRPLAAGRIGVASALGLLLLCLLVALGVVLALPSGSRGLCLALAMATLPLVLLYPSAKRWFPFPQIVLALCWGFAVLIPWAAATGSLAGGWPLTLCWFATVVWTFGFDTVYAMADRADDRRLGVRSSALSLGSGSVPAVALCYGLAWLALALAAVCLPLNPLFWPLWALAGFGLFREAWLLHRCELGPPDQRRSGSSFYGCQFAHQVQLGALLLLALIVGRA